MIVGMNHAEVRRRRSLIHMREALGRRRFVLFAVMEDGRLAFMQRVWCYMDAYVEQEGDGFGTGPATAVRAVYWNESTTPTYRCYETPSDEHVHIYCGAERLAHDTGLFRKLIVDYHVEMGKIR